MEGEWKAKVRRRSVEGSSKVRRRFVEGPSKDSGSIWPVVADLRLPLERVLPARLEAAQALRVERRREVRCEMRARCAGRCARDARADACEIVRDRACSSERVVGVPITCKQVSVDPKRTCGDGGGRSVSCREEEAAVKGRSRPVSCGRRERSAAAQTSGWLRVTAVARAVGNGS